jgi:hypothetical protein
MVFLPSRPDEPRDSRLVVPNRACGAPTNTLQIKRNEPRRQLPAGLAIHGRTHRRLKRADRADQQAEGVRCVALDR